MVLSLARQNKLSVALLLSDLHDAKEISKVFRKVGILPHVYEDLSGFWQGILVNTPSLCFIDVGLMSRGDLTLSMHPLVKTGELPVSFFYSEATKPLVYSTHDIFNLGLIEKGPSYEGPIKSLLKRLNRIIRLEVEGKDLRLENQKYTTQISKLLENSADIKEGRHYEDIYAQLSEKFELFSAKGDFLEMFEKVVSGWSEVSEFSVLEISPNGQKLISSSSIYSEKFKRLPSLWPGETCLEGIELAAQDLAASSALDILGGEIMSLNIRGVNKNPDLLIYVKLNDLSFLNGFPWSKLEAFLSSFYTTFELKKLQGMESSDQVITPYELLSFIDRFSFGRKPGEKIGVGETKYKLININFSDMLDLIMSSPAQRFHYNDFFRDFFGKMNSNTHFDFRISCMGVENIGLITTEAQADGLFDYLKGHVLRYPFWKFFDNADIVLTRKMRPEISFSPFSSTAYLNLINQIEFRLEDAGLQKEATERTRKMIWGEAPSESM